MNKLAQETGEDKSHLIQMRNGKRPLNPRVAAKLAALVGDDPREAALSALLAQEKHEANRVELAKLFRLPATATALALALLLSPDSQANQRLSADYHAGSVRYVKSRRWLAALMAVWMRLRTSTARGIQHA